MDLETATESTFAKAVTRFVVPVLLVVIGSLITWLITDVRGNQVQQQQEMQALTLKVERVDSKVELMNSKVDNGLIWRISELERRLQTVESAARTP
ncbi:hypothetical protein PQS31_06205 [Luteimonas sp BLCC-B24]|uniref:hypothetical protein n=1 Tax=Luteimonas sp. BLCC-B24 TaxID=3025317 RepID=UPI00234D2D87|nr:hypothetical protein [Luteimonas sp. BLCC-B24]MDC7806416.1 hypothetical protein [Luteimonas sp. BLCC-B24]